MTHRPGGTLDERRPASRPTPRRRNETSPMHGKDATPATRRSGRARIVAASGALLAAGALITAATLTDSADVVVTMDGTHNAFDIMTAGSVEPGWEPAASDWAQGNPAAFEIRLTDDGSDYVLSPGGALDLRVAARDASPRLSARLSLTILDPDPRGDAINPETGGYEELYDQLVFTVHDGTTTIFDAVPAAELTTYTWDDALPAGTSKLLDVHIELPESVGNDWQLASTDIQLHFEAVNA